MKGVGPVHLRLADSDFATFKQVFVGREYDLRAVGGAGPRIAARCRAIRNSGQVPIIVDAGANVGAASLWFARSFPDAQIVATEPDPENVKLLRINLKDEPRISVLEAEIAGEAGCVSLTHTAVGWAVQTVRSDDGEFPAITMGEAVASLGLGPINGIHKAGRM